MNADVRRIWGSFICFYTWYQVAIYNFTHSPLGDLIAANAAVDSRMLLMLVNLALGASVLISLFLIKGRDLQRNRALWGALHLLAFVALLLVPVAKDRRVVYALAVLSGLLTGVVFYRIFYCGFFYVPKLGWPRMVAVAYTMINGFIHLFTLTHGHVDPRIMYAVMMSLFGLGTVWSLSYRGSTMAIRSRLPEHKFSVQYMLPMALLIVGVQICYAAYKTLVLPAMPEDLSTSIYQVVINAVALVLLFAFGNRLGLGAFVRLFLGLVAAAFISFQVLGAGGRNVVETFMQPAYYCFDLLLFCYLCNLFHHYGKHHMRLHAALALLLLALALSESAASFVFHQYLSFSIHNFGLLYIVVVGLVMMIPWIDRVLTSFEDCEAPPPDPIAQPEGVLACCEIQQRDVSVELLARLPETERLTAREEEVLRLLGERQDADVIAHLLGISLSTTRTHIRHILDKYGVRSCAELLLLVGELEGVAPFSLRELDVLGLMAEGLDDAEIAAKLFISPNTVRSHVHNMCTKSGARSRKELSERYAPRQPERLPMHLP